MRARTHKYTHTHTHMYTYIPIMSSRYSSAFNAIRASCTYPLHTHTVAFRIGIRNGYRIPAVAVADVMVHPF